MEKSLADFSNFYLVKYRIKKYTIMKHTIYWLFAIFMLAACNRPVQFASFDEYPVYDGDDLELTYTPEKSTFVIWAPTASEVKLLLFDNGHEGGAFQTSSMKRSRKGTWRLEIKEDLKGKFYTFQVKVGEQWLSETPGMWVKATGANGKRAAIIDFSETNPEGWENDVRPKLKNFTDIILYEVHMRDFSVSPTSGITNKGKFLAFTEHGTKNAAGQSTGIDHLVELGVTHVHLLPSYDFASIDETKLHENNYNWGYDPLNYNVPEGSYSTDPYHPVVRIKEFKQMVQALHKAGIRVIMDVVYNHTYTGENSHLNLLVPGYFYRMRDDGTWSDASGCGNETASERAMMRKFIVESVVFWATEYKVDGFRFDLMGIHDIETMNAVRQALDAVDPTLFIYGEGWTAADSPLPLEKRAIKQNAKELNGIAVFSDDIRDALKGSWMHSEIPGFVAGVDSLEESVKFGLVGGVLHEQVDYSRLLYSKAPYVNSPSQIINYVSCHDDLCLVDKLRESKPAYASETELIRFNKLAQTVVFVAQGIPFIYAGEELYRDKKGIHNTYQSPDSINQIDWDNKTRYNDIYNYYKGLVALRNQHPAFRMPTQEMVQKHLKFLDVPDKNVVAFMLTGNANGDSWKRILVILNGNRSSVAVNLPQGEWTMVCHDGQIDLEGIAKVNYTTQWIAPSSATIMYAN